MTLRQAKRLHIIKCPIKTKGDRGKAFAVLYPNRTKDSRAAFNTLLKNLKINPDNYKHERI